MQGQDPVHVEQTSEEETGGDDLSRLFVESGEAGRKDPRHMISVLIPVLNRPGNAPEVLASLMRSQCMSVQPVFICSPGDDAQIDACVATGAWTLIAPFEIGHGDYARKINLGLNRITAEWVFTGADDLCFCPEWDVELMKTAEKTGAMIIGTDDLWNPAVKAGHHSTHTLVNRDYALEHGCSWDNQPGVIYHEGYTHQYVDTELVAVAKQRRIWAFAKRAKVEHLHPFAGKSTRDTTYDKALVGGSVDSRLFKTRQGMFG